MYVLWLFIASVIGGQEHIAKMESYDTEEECQKAMVGIIEEMDKVYTKPEEKTYRFECLHRFVPPSRMGV